MIYDNLNKIHGILCNLKFSLFCDKECHLKEYNIVNKVICEFTDEKLCKSKFDKCECEKCISLIDLLILDICSIQDCSYCIKNYAYLLYLDRVKCTLINLKILFCQLKCFPIKDCELLSEFLCVLFEIVELIENIISKINNIECLCKSNLCSKSEVLECMLCILDDNISKLEKCISILGHLVLQIACLNVINCTTCTTPKICGIKNTDYLSEYYKLYYSNFDCENQKPPRYYK